MGDLTRNFSRSEFTCKCGCGFDTVDYELAFNLQLLRDALDQQVLITSGCRCHKHNLDIGGSLASYHLQSKACDFVVPWMKPEQIFSVIQDLFPNKYGVGVYPKKGHIHFDVRKIKARWYK